MGKPTKAAILEGAKQHEAQIEYFRKRAPYFPDYYYETQMEDGRQVHHITCKVRHKHKGTWYARHHYYTTITEKTDEALKWFLRQVYGDIMFGQIHPEITRVNGEPLDPIDEIQKTEAERLKLLKNNSNEEDK